MNSVLELLSEVDKVLQFKYKNQDPMVNNLKMSLRQSKELLSKKFEEDPEVALKSQEYIQVNSQALMLEAECGCSDEIIRKKSKLRKQIGNVYRRLRRLSLKQIAEEGLVDYKRCIDNYRYIERVYVYSKEFTWQPELQDYTKVADIEAWVKEVEPTGDGKYAVV